MSYLENDCQKTSWNTCDKKALEYLQEFTGDFALGITKPLILVNITTQRLHFAYVQKMKCSYPISSALNGTGQEEGSYKTPLGLHCIESKIGHNADPFAIFKSRIPTGELAFQDLGEEKIVARILRLKGLQPGFNMGKDRSGQVVDTFERYIYIHGTNLVSQIGEPVSRGCIRMIPSHVIDLFEKVDEETLVHIYRSEDFV